MTTKLRIKMGQVEVECEGSDDFLRKELPALLKVVLELRGPAVDSSGTGAGAPGDIDDAKLSNGSNLLTVSTIAAKIGVKSGSDLALAAIAALVIGGKNESVSRSEILQAMQSAKAYYKTSFGSNLTKSLVTLVRAQDILEQGNNRFGLQQNKRQELAQKLV